MKWEKATGKVGAGPVRSLGPPTAYAVAGVGEERADAHVQGRTMGSVSALNSLMAVVAPVLGAPLLGAVSHLPQGDWRIGAPFYLCAAIQAIAAVIGLRYFSRAFHEAPARTVRTGA